MNYLSIFIIATAGVLSFFGIKVFRKYSLNRNWLDVPNERSSHDRPTPRGAGLVVVTVCLVGYLLTVQLTGIRFSWGYFIGAVLVALVSWMDDLYSISFIWRLTAHLLAAIIILTSEGSWETISLGNGSSYPLSSIGPTLSVFWIVWVINAYNFMDGIDGIAALQGLTAAAAWAVIGSSAAPVTYLFPSIIFASLVGFALHNWHPAKVFIGDVGSAFLGFTFAALPFIFAHEQPLFSDKLPLASILILWPFLFDTILTLVRRMMRGEMVWQAHREHLYQLLVISGFSQPTVAIVYGVFAILTAAAGVMLTYGLLDLLVVIGLTACMSAVLVLSVALVYRQHSRVDHVKHGA
jgi:Fuc2NAc and GlcNAc transferase